jgi:hypothetical protein
VDPSKLREAKAENKELQNRIKALEMDLKKSGGGGPDIEVSDTEFWES